MNTFLGIMAALFAIVLIGALSVGGMILAGVIQWETAGPRGALEANEIIQANGRFRIAAYTKFYNDCGSIQALESEYDAQAKLLVSVTNPDRREIIETNLAAIGGARDGAVRRYNIDSHKEWTEAQFKSTALAYQLPTAAYTGGNKTVCVLQTP